jgi:hypothetical protein
MAKGALFIGWGSLIPGREKIARAVFDDAVEYCARMQNEGRIDTFDVVSLEPDGGDMEGFVLVKGEKGSLAELRSQDEFLRTIIRETTQRVGSSVHPVELQRCLSCGTRSGSVLSPSNYDDVWLWRVIAGPRR